MAAAWVAPAIGAAGNIFGGLFGNSSARKEAQKQREWQEYMSNTAHQREVKDLRAAGMNPILTATGGSGASTPSGAIAQQSGFDFDGISESYNSAKRLEEIEKQQLKNETDLKNSQTELNKSNMDLNKKTGAKLDADTILSNENAETARFTRGWTEKMNSVLMEEAIARIVNSAKVADAQAFNLYAGALTHYSQAELNSALKALTGQKEQTEKYAKDEQRARSNVWSVAGDFTDFLRLGGRNYAPGGHSARSIGSYSGD